MSEFRLRRFRPEDRERVRELAVEAMRDTPEWVPDAPDEDLQDVRGHYIEAGGEFLVGERAGRIVATGAYEPLAGWMAEQFPDCGPETAEVSRMRVAPGHRRRGHGQAIYDELESRARDDGYRTLVLNTGVENDRARAFYEANGFDHVENRTVDFGGVTLDLALYRNSIR